MNEEEKEKKEEDISLVSSLYLQEQYFLQLEKNDQEWKEMFNKLREENENKLKEKDKTIKMLKRIIYTLLIAYITYISIWLAGYWIFGSTDRTFIRTDKNTNIENIQHIENFNNKGVDNNVRKN